MTVCQAQEKQLAIQKKDFALVDRARAEAPVLPLARQEPDTWVTLPNTVATLMVAEVTVKKAKQTPRPVRPVRPVISEAAILQKVLETNVGAQNHAPIDLGVNSG